MRLSKHRKPIVKSAKRSNSFKCEHCKEPLPIKVFNSNYCPQCCALTPSYKKVIQELLSRAHLIPELKDASRQYLKGEYISAVRTATIVVEQEVKKLIGNGTLFGIDLMAKAFSFTFDDSTKSITKEPLIKINTLQTTTERNEQEGMKFLCMGLMMGCRNIFAHSNFHAAPSDCLSIIMMCNFVITQFKNDSLTRSIA
jgi:uncharacterized protein (TIGR02391 family)